MPIRLLSLDVTDTLLEWSATIGTLYHRGPLADSSLPFTQSTRNIMDYAYDDGCRIRFL